MKIRLESGSKSGGKFWQIVTKGKSWTVTYGKIGSKGVSTIKAWSSATECKKEAEKKLKQKRKKGYKAASDGSSGEESESESEAESESESESESAEPDPKPAKRKTKTKTKNSQKKKNTKKKTSKKMKPPPKKKRKLIVPESEGEASESGSEGDEDEDDERARLALKDNHLLYLTHTKKQRNIDLEIMGKKYVKTEGNIGAKGRRSTRTFRSKTSAIAAALKIAIRALDDGFEIDEEEEEEEESGSGSGSGSDVDADAGVLSDITICISGGFSKVATQSKMRSLIEDNGGIHKNSVTKDTQYVVVNDIGPNLQSTKCDKAQANKIPVLCESWILDSIDKGKLQPIAKYIKLGVHNNSDSESESESESESGSAHNNNNNSNRAKTAAKTKSKTKGEQKQKSSSKSKSYKKLIMKGKAPVDELFPYKDRCHVYDEGAAEVYDAMLNQTNIKNNNNKFYKIQVLEKDDNKGYYAWFRWGRVGYNGQNTLISGGKEKCIKQFCDKFHAKTSNNWANRNSFVPKTRKYTFLPMDYSNDVDMKDDTDSSESESDSGSDSDSNTNKSRKKKKKSTRNRLECKLEDAIQELIQLIFDKRMMESQMKEIGYDAEKLPLGRLDSGVISDAYLILKEIETFLLNKKKKKKNARSRLIDLSSDYYTLIPHTFGMKTPPAINNDEMLKNEMQLVESLSEIELASRLLKGENRDSNVHPIDRHYLTLKCVIESVADAHPDFTMIDNYVQRTHAATHNAYSLEVERVYRLNREGSADRFEPFAKDPNRMLLWHGSRLTNFVGIISQGLRIAPPEAPVTGYMFGKGVYFADMCSKSANYCFTSGSNPTGLILLCEVALGNMNELHASDYYASDLPAGTISTKGVGETFPDPKTYVKLENGCTVPSGVSKQRPNPLGTLRYNEYIVYDTKQIKMRYLIRLKFNYSHGNY